MALLLVVIKTCLVISRFSWIKLLLDLSLSMRTPTQNAIFILFSMHILLFQSFIWRLFLIRAYSLKQQWSAYLIKGVPKWHHGKLLETLDWDTGRDTGGNGHIMERSQILGTCYMRLGEIKHDPLWKVRENGIHRYGKKNGQHQNKITKPSNLKGRNYFNKYYPLQITSEHPEEESIEHWLRWG